MLEVRWVNRREVIRAHNTLIASTETAIHTATSLGAAHAKDHVNRYNRFKRRTGNLQRSTKAHIFRRKAESRLRLDNTAKYADAIDQGARPHVIRPRRARALRFVVRGRVVFARKVNHPGNRPYKFMYRAWHSAGRVEYQFLLRHMTALARRF